MRNAVKVAEFRVDGEQNKKITKMQKIAARCTSHWRLSQSGWTLL